MKRLLITGTLSIAVLAGCAPVSDEEVASTKRNAAERVIWSVENLAKVAARSQSVTTAEAFCMARVQTTLVDSYKQWMALGDDGQRKVFERMYRECV